MVEGEDEFECICLPCLKYVVLIVLVSVAYLVGGIEFVIHKASNDTGLAYRLISEEDKLIFC